MVGGEYRAPSATPAGPVCAGTSLHGRRTQFGKQPHVHHLSAGTRPGQARVAALPAVPLVPVHPHLSTVVPWAPPLPVCPLLELPSLGSVAFLTVSFVCAPVSGTTPTPTPHPPPPYHCPWVPLPLTAATNSCFDPVLVRPYPGPSLLSVPGAASCSKPAPLLCAMVPRLGALGKSPFLGVLRP